MVVSENSKKNEAKSTLLPDANRASPSVCMYTLNGLMEVTSTYSLRSNLLPSISNGRSMYLQLKLKLILFTNNERTQNSTPSIKLITHQRCLHRRNIRIERKFASFSLTCIHSCLLYTDLLLPLLLQPHVRAVVVNE